MRLAAPSPRRVGRALLLPGSVVLVWLALAGPGSAAEPAGSASEGDQLDYRVSLDTYQRLFQRAALPGPAGALVVTETAAPIYQYTLLGVRNVDAPWARDSVDVELAAWGNVEPGDVGVGARRVDGDIQILLARHHVGPASFTLGRQLRIGGAARLTRFDGLAAGVRAPFGIGADAYGGWLVLPRWDARPGYHLLGSAADTLVRDPTALEDEGRGGAWLAGGRVYYSRPGLVEGGVSLHEQRATSGELDRRTLGLDGHTTPLDWLGVAAQANLDLDAARLSDLRLSADAEPIRKLTLIADFAHLTPALYLSRQSVLSVFSVDAFDELGGSVGYRPLAGLGLRASGHIQFFEGGRRGARGAVGARYSPERLRSLTVSAEYGRLVEVVNGYHLVRGGAHFAALSRLELTADLYGYFYDEPVADVSSSLVGAATGSWRFARWISLMIGSSVARTPYAAVDLQQYARLSLMWDGTTRQGDGRPGGTP